VDINTLKTIAQKHKWICEYDNYDIENNDEEEDNDKKEKKK
jgi:hypothetical protein